MAATGKYRHIYIKMLRPGNVKSQTYAQKEVDVPISSPCVDSTSVKSASMLEMNTLTNSGLCFDTHQTAPTRQSHDNRPTNLTGSPHVQG